MFIIIISLETDVLCVFFFCKMFAIFFISSLFRYWKLLFTASAGNEALMARPGTNYYERNCHAGGGPAPGTPSTDNLQGTLFSRTDTVLSKLRVNTVVQHAACELQ
jgi:hypothetical protein